MDPRYQERLLFEKKEEAAAPIMSVIIDPSPPHDTQATFLFPRQLLQSVPPAFPVP